MKPLKGARPKSVRVTLPVAVLIIIACLGPSSSNAAAQTYFFNRTDLLSAAGGRVVASGDFNSDGKPDLAVVNDYTNPLALKPIASEQRS